MTVRIAAFASLTALLGSVACGSPAAPFDKLASANVVAYRLQNYEPPTPQVGATAQPGAIPGIPAEIQQWAQQAVPALQQMIPPGILPPGLIPGLPQAVPQQPAVQERRFHGFRILQENAVLNPELKEDVADLLGDDGSFQTQHSNCMYAEMGLSFSTTPGAPPNDVLISFSCNQMQGHNFVWPHQTTGMTTDTVKSLADLVAQLFPPQQGQPVAVSQL